MDMINRHHPIGAFTSRFCNQPAAFVIGLSPFFIIQTFRVKINAMKKNAFRTVLLFFLCYLLPAGLLLYYFISSDHSLVYQGDGWRQHLRALAYYGKYLRGCLRHLLVDHSLTPQTFGPDFGYGADILTTLQYYCLGDPLAALSVFVPTSCTIYLYEGLILLRPFLAGLAFILYARTRGENRTTPVLTGALTYAFSGTVLYIGMLHPYFVNPMIWLPLLLAGIEHAIGEGTERKLLARLIPFSIAVALSALCNFYFFYMLVIFTAAYGIARLLQLAGESGLRGSSFLRTVGGGILRLFCAGVVGTLCAGITLVPVLVQFKEDPRAATARSEAFLYDAEYYRQLPVNLVSFINHPQLDTELCFALPFLLFALLLFLRRGHRTLKICLALTTLLLLLPAAATVLNGFSYPINRWTWAAAMLAGWICVRGMQVCCPENPTMCLNADRASNPSEASSVPESTIPRATSHGRGTPILSFCLSILLPVLTLASILWNIRCGYAPDQGAFPEEFRPRMNASSYAEEASANEVTAVAASLPESPGFVRYSGRNLNWNAALSSGLSSTQFEFSLANGSVSDVLQLIGVNDEQNCAYLALEDRMPALSLAGVNRYTLAYDNYYEYRHVPWGFQDLGLYDNYRVFDNPNALPPGFLMKRAISMDVLRSLPLPVREEVLLQAAALEDADLGDVAGYADIVASPVNANDGGISYELAYSLSGDALLADNANMLRFANEDTCAEVIFSAPVPAGCELYLCLENLWVDVDDTLCTLSFEAQLDGEEWITREINYKTPASQYYSNWHDFALCFGSAGEGVDRIRISAEDPCTLTFDRLYVMIRPMDSITGTLAALQQTGMTDTDLHMNAISRATSEITGRVHADDASLLILQFPYSRGFKAFVDGTPAPVYKADAMFLAIPVDAGDHAIRVTYRTPGYIAGALCSLTGVLLLIFIALFGRKSANR